MALPSRTSLRQGAEFKPLRWLSAITLKATNELYQKCAEHDIVLKLGDQRQDACKPRRLAFSTPVHPVGEASA